ncbi:phosphoserine phosphatase [Bacillus salacetis]|uniref:Phosphoserine phosphatase n=1 Tax=Bacillus salacetis TaxID=2315464 RepID=A0A3A1QY27_9BACI|nr:PP2C family serine/threonine-protein phosphatase [Bacillus salacetis]RIW32755.1 phosphoserine phosphatase [Bacillus salacetis]
MTHLVQDQIEVYAKQVAKGKNPYCGDSFFFTSTDDYFICILADGLGSGEFAYESSNAVVELVEKHHHEDVSTLIDYCNQELMHKRGAAVAIMKAYYGSNEFEYSCVGNIRFYLYSSGGKMTYPLPVTGYLSGRPQKYRTQRFTYEPQSKFLLHSDGLNITNIKSLLQNSNSLRKINDEISLRLADPTDDTTFIVGSLL